MSKYNILNTKKKTILCRIGTKHDPGVIVMQQITPKEEEEIDNSVNENVYKRSRFYLNPELFVEGKEILAYGEINLKNEDDINLIRNLPILDDKVMDCGNIIPTTFDYNAGTIDGINPWSHTWDNLLWFKYHHCMIGKPERIIIYRISMKNYNRLDELYRMENTE